MKGREQNEWHLLFHDHESYSQPDEVPINREIRGLIAASTTSVEETISELLRIHVQVSRHNDLKIFCLVQTAIKAGLKMESIQAAGDEDTTVIKECIVRARAKRERVDKRADELLVNKWGGWNICGRV